jgi:hypothetical protein
MIEPISTGRIASLLTAELHATARISIHRSRACAFAELSLKAWPEIITLHTHDEATNKSEFSQVLYGQ